MPDLLRTARRPTTIRLVAAALCLAYWGFWSPSASPAVAQEAAAPAPAETPRDGLSAPPDRRDPTTAQGELRRLLNQREEVAGAAVAAPTPPALELKGRIIGGLKKPTVLLSLDEKQAFLLHEGDSCRVAGRANQTIRLVEVTRDRVVVEWLVDGDERRQLLLP